MRVPERPVRDEMPLEWRPGGSWPQPEGSRCFSSSGSAALADFRVVRSPKRTGPENTRPTIRDVAAKADVSPMSVSRVLNNGPHISLEVRARVKRAVRELNYVPNHTARRLVERQQSHNIAFLFDTPNAAVLGDMVSTGCAEAVSSDAELVFIKILPNREPSKIRKSLANLGIEGVILSPPLCDQVGLRNALSGAGIRIVAIGNDDRSLRHSTIGIDDARAAYQLTQHLLGLGHRQIGFIGGPRRHRSSARRSAGYAAALLEYGLEPNPSLQWEGEYTYASALAAAGKALSREPRPTAIFAANDDMAAAVISVAKGRGILVPDALTVCGFDDSEIALMVSPQLTTVSQPVGAMAEWAVRQLVRELTAIKRGQEPDVRKVVLPHTIIHRETDVRPPGAGASCRGAWNGNNGVCRDNSFVSEPS
jgi:LacI family transcriptional regulator